MVNFRVLIPSYKKQWKDSSKGKDMGEYIIKGLNFNKQFDYCWNTYSLK